MLKGCWRESYWNDDGSRRTVPTHCPPNACRWIAEYVTGCVFLTSSAGVSLGGGEAGGTSVRAAIAAGGFEVGATEVRAAGGAVCGCFEEAHWSGRVNARATNTSTNAAPTIQAPHRRPGRAMADCVADESEVRASSSARPVPLQAGHVPPHPSCPVPLQVSQDDRAPITPCFGRRKRSPQSSHGERAL